ncbi:MAG: carbon monoxide dehydrogenase [Rhodospirillaceae bacterium]|nr:carbon monoxide dehydrogenase [Rhodospirillaceae bacterium]
MYKGGQIRLGEPIPRIEDERMLLGKARYANDIALPQLCHAYILRSPHAHAKILEIDITSAATAPGILKILTGQDVKEDELGDLTCHSFPELPSESKAFCPSQPLLANDTVRFVGEGIALIIGETREQAEDAAELLVVKYEVLPAVTFVDAYKKKGNKVWEQADGNVSFQIKSGDLKKIDEKFSSAHHVSELTIQYPRTTANTLETRCTLAYYDQTDGRMTLCSSTQEPHEVRQVIANTLDIPQNDIRVMALDVGGAFGMKGQVYPEDILVVWAASKLNKPVKWSATRTEAILTDMHGRSPLSRASLAFDKNGKIIAFKTSVTVDVGAYLSIWAGIPPRNATISFPGPYHIPHIYAEVTAIFTNTTLLGPYRGSGKPEATYTLERLINDAAIKMGFDPIDLRRQNLIGTDKMPYKTPGGYVYDTGDFNGVLQKAIKLVKWDHFNDRKAQSINKGRLRGIGLALHCQRAGTFSERMEIRVEPDGGIAAYVGTLSTGQGHETMFTQMISGWLGVPLEEIRIFQGDTDKFLFGRGTFAQRSMATGGSALKHAADEVIYKGRRISAWLLEVSEADIVFKDGEFVVNGTDRSITFKDTVKASYMGAGLPLEFGIGIDGIGHQEGTYSFPNGCMICEAEVDPETGKIEVDRSYAIDDVGVVVNPLTLEGQLHGSIAQGLGEALVEEIIYNQKNGQLLTGSFMDYGLPRADMMPDIISDVWLKPSTNNPLGVKGGSEAGNCGMPSAIIHAILDALKDYGVTDLPLPATPERVWKVIKNNHKV